MEIFPETLKKLWNLWEIRSLVLLSLSLQIILIVFGSRRKTNNPQSWIGIFLNVIVWCAYISADWVATVALSIIASNRADCQPGLSKASDSLQAFWAPFLLLHLGGPDTITAYSLEDNELWLRHSLGLIVQVGVSFYVFLRFWSSDALTFLAIPVFIAGIVKYGERTWTLWSSSTQHFKDSLGSSPDCCIDLFGYERSYIPKLVMKEGINSEDHNLVQAYYSYKRLEYLFANQIINESRYYNYSIINGKSAEDAFKLVSIELGLMYDMLYTKAAIAYSRVGICLRCISFVSSVSALVLFSIIIDKHSHPLIDITVTYMLLAGAVVLEIYAFIILFSSDWTRIWLVKFKVAPHNNNKMSKTLVDNFWRFTSCLHSRLSTKKRWSESIGQYNLMNSALKERQSRTCLGLDKLSCISELLDKYEYLTCENVNISLQETIFKYLKEIANELKKSHRYFQESRDEKLANRGEYALKDYSFGDPLVSEEYDARIITWHIVTDECYKDDLNHVNGDANKLDQNCKTSKWLSDYMLYLLLFCSSMLPKGMGEIRYEQTYMETKRAYNKSSSKQRRRRANKGTTPENCSQSVLKMARGIASQLKEDENGWGKRWEMISEVWLEMLAYAAHNCGWQEHAQHLWKGGELLTHISVLMVNFGLNKQVMFKGYI